MYHPNTKQKENSLLSYWSQMQGIFMLLVKIMKTIAAQEIFMICFVEKAICKNVMSCYNNGKNTQVTKDWKGIHTN